MRRLTKRIALLTAICLLFAQLSFMPRVEAAGDEPELILDGTWDVYDWVSNDHVLYAGYDPDFGDTKAVLRFNLPDAAGREVTGAELRLHLSQVNAQGGGAAISLKVFGSEDDNWSGGAPPSHSSESLDNIPGHSLTNGQVVFDVTSFVKQQMDGQATLIVGTDEGDNGRYLNVVLNAQEAGNPSYRPRLLLTYADPVVTSLAPAPIMATTTEDSAATGIVVAKDPADGTAVTHFKITGITGGRLFLADGTTEILDDQYITVVQGMVGLAFMPDADANTAAGDTFSFTVQAAQDNAGKGISAAATANITVTEENDKPVPADDTLTAIEQDSGTRSISFAALTANDSAGAVNESGQTLEIMAVTTDPLVGSVMIDGSNVLYTPAAGYHGPASFTYRVRDNGTTNGAADPQSSDVEATVSFTVEGMPLKPSVTDAATMEDTKSSTGLVITADDSGGVTTHYYRISEITGGTLYKTNGTTMIMEGDYITTSEGAAGLKFMPASNLYGAAGIGFLVQASPVNDGTKLSAAAAARVTVVEVNDSPVAVDDSYADIDEDAAPLRIPVSHLLANDSSGPNESDQELTVTLGSATGGTIAMEEGDILFTPAPNYNGPAGFMYTVTDNGTTNGMPDAKSDEAVVSFTIRPIADIPIVTDAETDEDTLSSSGLVLTRNDADGMEVVYLTITGIHGGTLYLNDGTTPITDGSYITTAHGGAGLKFKPDPDANSEAGNRFGFNVQAALDTTGTGLSDTAEASITVNAVNDAPNAVDDSLSAVAESSGEHRIPGSLLLANDDAGASNEADQTLTIDAVEAIAGGSVELDGTDVIFTLQEEFRGTASFKYTVSDDGGLTAEAIVEIPVDAKTDMPVVTSAATHEDTMTTSGLVITPTFAGGSTTTHYVISGVVGGRLYKNDGVTEILSGDVITAAEGAAGLRFAPAADAHGTTGFGFRVQAAAGADGRLLSGAAEAVITVNEVNDAPTAANDELPQVAQGTAVVPIAYGLFTANDDVGPEDERLWQTLTVTDVTAVAGGTVEIVNGRVEFRPVDGFSGTAKFTYTVRDDGRTNGVDDYKTATAQVSFDIVDENAPVITLHGDTTVYVLKGSAFVEGGYAAYDDEEGDLTPMVTVTGMVDTDTLGTYTLRYNVSDGAGNTAMEAVRTVHIVSNELAVLEAAGLTLAPAFTPGHETYDLRAASLLEEVVVTASTVDPTATATVTINGETATDGERSVELATGSNTVTVVVTAQGGSTKTYTLTITRPALPTLTLNGDATIYVLKGSPYVEPGFSAADSDEDDLTGAVQVTGTIDTDTLGTYTLRYNVSDGAGNVAAEATRTVRVVSDVLAGLTVEGSAVTPDFEAGRLDYEVQVGYSQANAAVAAEAYDPTASVTVNGEAVGSSGSHDVALNVGRNAVEIIVTAEGGSTRTYTLDIVRQSAPPLVITTPAPQTRQAKVVAGTEMNVVQVDVTRTMKGNGLAVDAVALQGEKVDEVIAKAKAADSGMPRIVIDDLPEQPADAIELSVSSEALGKLKASGLGFIVEAGGVVVTLRSDMISGLSGEDRELFFRIVPIRKNDETQQVHERVLDAQELRHYAGDRTVQAVGSPMTIETNYSNRDTNVMFPLAGIDLPHDPKARAKYLDSLAVFVEHSDGEKAVKNGIIVYDEQGTPVGIEIKILKFSTFTIVSTAAAYTEYASYISGYPDGMFRMTANISRAETAAILARLMNPDKAEAPAAYTDLAAHWASDAVQRLTAAGILSGDPDGRFRAGDGVTRAEMAMIAARVWGLDVTAAALGSATFADVPEGHWAAGAIAKVKEAGLMVGNEEGMFQPDRMMTRDEAVTVFNRLFERPALSGSAGWRWGDVDPRSWAARDIESASRSFRVYADGRVELLD